MGRISTPIMNKTGYSMYWNSVWDDKTNYSRSFKDDIFLKEFIYLFFEGGSFSSAPIDLKNYKNKFNFFNKKYFFNVQKFFKKSSTDTKTIFKYLVKRKKTFKPFLSKVWVLKYQAWVIIYFFSYSFSLSVFCKKKLNLREKRYRYPNILSKYYNSIFKLKYNYKLYKKSFNFKTF